MSDTFDPANQGVEQHQRAAETLSEEVLNEVEEDQEEARRSEKEQHGRRKWPWITALAVVVLAGAYAGTAYALGDRVPSGTKVASVDIGGMNRQDAIDALNSALAPVTKNPVQVLVGEETTPQTIDPTSFSLALDSAATVNQVVGFSWSPAKLWNHISGGTRIDPVLTVDNAALEQTLATLSADTTVAPQDATVSFVVPDGDGAPSVSVTPEVKGTGLDTAVAEKQLASDILTAAQPIHFPVTSTSASITDEVAAAAQKNAETLISAPLSVTVAGKVVELTPRQLAAATTFQAKDGALAVTVDGKNLGDIVRQGAADVLTPGTDARIEIVDHTTPTIVPSTSGVGIDDAALAEQVAKVGVTTDRNVALDTVEVPAAFSTADAEAMGIKEVVSHIETPLTSDNVRTKNLLTGTSLITNTLVKPGETFSLTEALGDISEARGFVSSGVVENGFNSEALGGGLSQLSTNTFNIGYLAGFVDVEHQPHSKYFSRYPMGREATLWYGQIDMKWQNNTPYGAVIDTWVADGYVHSQLWSTKYWDVNVTDSGMYNIVQPSTKNNPAADCEPSPAGGPGFTVTVTRTVSHDGIVNDDVSGSKTWTYQPVHAVTCNKS